MGIRLQCENCKNSLHLKSELAGRKGICPHCKNRFRIPAETNASDPIKRSSTSLLPNRLYWVSPPSGGRYGPADVSLLIQWAQQNRITEDSLLFEDSTDLESNPRFQEIAATGLRAEIVLSEYFHGYEISELPITAIRPNRISQKSTVNQEIIGQFAHKGFKSPLVAVKLKRNRAKNFKLITVCVLIAIVVLLAVALYRIMFFR